MITREQAETCNEFYHLRHRNPNGSAVKAVRDGPLQGWTDSDGIFHWQLTVRYHQGYAYQIVSGTAHEWTTEDPVVYSIVGLKHGEPTATVLYKTKTLKAAAAEWTRLNEHPTEPFAAFDEVLISDPDGMLLVPDTQGVSEFGWVYTNSLSL